MSKENNNPVIRNISWWKRRQLKKCLNSCRYFNVSNKFNSENEMLKEQVKIATEALKAINNGCDMMEYNRHTYTLPLGALAAIKDVEYKFTGKSDYERLLERLGE
ncbi:MAG: hypothetical protein IJV75_00340 [Alphaproteobacteria bacterium]|nr:hypothetical protein [Alphaproteobacteria bacterium]